MTKGDETLGSDLLEEFWCWAVAQYEDAQVREGLLELQERSNLIILEAMFLAWLGHRGQVISQTDHRCIREFISPWIEGVVLPLRRQRQAWTNRSSMTRFRTHLLGLELEAERVLAELLINTLPAQEAVEGGAVEVDRNLAFLPEIESAVTRDRVTKMLAR